MLVHKTSSARGANRQVHDVSQQTVAESRADLLYPVGFANQP